MAMWDLKAWTLVAMFEGGDLRSKGLQDLKTKDIWVGRKRGSLLPIRGRCTAKGDLWLHLLRCIADL